MKYILEEEFRDKPDCKRCMLGSSIGTVDGKMLCMALGIRPICPEEGCRKDCPLKPIEQ